MKLYYSPGACSLADHIALAEAGLKFDLAKVDLKSHTLEDGRPYAEVNPKNYVPALEFDDGALLTENVAILSWVADQAPALAPKGQMGRHRLLETLAYLSTELHKGFKPIFTPGTTDGEKQAARETVAKRLQFIASRFKGPYIFGESMSAADGYLFVMLLWAKKNAIEVPAALESFLETMKGRPAVQRALKEEGLRL
jgi:glutathione S-transferase